MQEFSYRASMSCVFNEFLQKSKCCKSQQPSGMFPILQTLLYMAKGTSTKGKQQIKTLFSSYLSESSKVTYTFPIYFLFLLGNTPACVGVKKTHLISRIKH